MLENSNQSLSSIKGRRSGGIFACNTKVVVIKFFLGMAMAIMVVESSCKFMVVESSCKFMVVESSCKFMVVESSCKFMVVESSCKFKAWFKVKTHLGVWGLLPFFFETSGGEAKFSKPITFTGNE